MVDDKRRKTPELLLYFIKIYPFRFLLALCALIVAGFIEIIGIGALLPLLNLVLEIDATDEPNALGQVVNAVFDVLGMKPSFENILLIIVFTVALKSFIIFQALKAVSYIAVDITYDLRLKLIQSWLFAKWNYYSTLNVGHSANSIATEADTAGQFCMITGKTIAAAVQVCVYTFIAFTIDWRVSLAAIVMGGAAAFILKFLVRMARDSGHSMAGALNRLLARLNEALSGAKPIKAMGEEDRYIKILQSDTMELQSARKKFAVASLLLKMMHEPLLIFFMAVGLLWAYKFASYPMSELFMMAFLFNRLLSQVNLVQGFYQKTAAFEGAVTGILEKIEAASAYQEANQGQDTPTLATEIKVEDLELSYEDNVVLQEFNHVIPACKMTVIFGPSGSGKSSLLDAILGLASYRKGDIYIDQVSLKDVDIQSWRQMIGYVPQETFLFHDTIMRNVTLGDERYSEEDVVDALSSANAWEFVKQIEGQVHHIVGERGGKLSGGQRQRIALARAIIRKPKFLILDEATSGLDKESETTILKTLKDMLPDVTILMISHDPKILDIADHVIKMEKGE
ncbi:MAG: ABC transporter ATP-binding protein [Alphaproteobacteria bacterium]